VSDSYDKEFALKLSAAYERDPDSPLFLRKAQLQIEEESFDDALATLNDGLKNYPDHPAAFFLLGKALALMEKYEQAIDAVKKGSKLINSRETYDYYVERVWEARRRSPEGRAEEEPEPPAFDDPEEEAVAEKPDAQEKTEPDFDERLADLARQIADDDQAGARPKSERETTDDVGIASETLAKIYVKQGELAEAIKVYEKLAIAAPAEDHPRIRRIIDDLNDRLEAE
jgi:tetratricopeptide (TPR) repeat protein